MRLIDADEIHWDGLADCPGKEYAKYLIDHLPDMKIDGRLSPKMVTCPVGGSGQAILFPKQEYDKENNKILLNFDETET